MAIAVTVFNDPGCPWAYSAIPSLTLMRWRYGDQLRWRLVTIGLTERAEQYEERGYTPLMMALSAQDFRRYGMPFAPQRKERVAATARACRAVVATRLLAPEHEWAALRALQFAHFTTPMVLDEDEQLLEPLSGVAGLDAARVVAALDDPDVSVAYEHDRAEARTASGSRRSSRASPRRPTAPSATPLRRWSSQPASAAWRRAASSPPKPTTC